jgi:RNA polymerase sigma-70 factor (ECF subfamily)
MSLDNEYKLIKNLIEGDAAAFSQVFDLYKDKVYAFAFTLTKSRDTSEEVVQEVFLRLWERKKQIRREEQFAPYVRRVTYNCVMDFFRKAKLDLALQNEILRRFQDIQSSGEEAVLSRELQETYHKAIAQLPPQQKRAYLLSREEGLSYDEIASVLGTSRNTVRNQLSEAIKNVRQYVYENTDLAILILVTLLQSDDTRP